MAKKKAGKKTAKKAPKSLIKILTGDYSSCIEVGYTRHRSNHCDCYMGCKKCVTLTDVNINEIYDNICVTITNAICKNRTLTNMQTYCIDRLLRCAKIYKLEYWTANTEAGYYGEELGSVTLDHFTAIELEKSISKIMEMDRCQQIEFVLQKEYGFLLDIVKNLDWNDDFIKRDKIIIGQQDYYRHVDPDVVEMYKAYPFAKGVFVKQDDQYRLIDGYHRIAAELSRESKEEIHVIVGESWA